jgi:hypothetical protein
VVPYLEFGYVKMCEKKKSHVAYRVKLGKIVKTSSDHNFQLGAWI